MPYGISKEHGGDSAENVAKVDRCVKRVMSDGTPKSRAIAICFVASVK